MSPRPKSIEEGDTDLDGWDDGETEEALQDPFVPPSEEQENQR